MIENRLKGVADANREGFWDAWENHPLLRNDTLQDNRKAFKKLYPRIQRAFMDRLPLDGSIVIITDVTSAQNRAISQVLREKYGITEGA